MPDQHIREIQVSGKQLVFLFMASVIVAVAVFLLGVSVGRGVRENVATSAAAAPVATASDIVAAPVELPPPTQLNGQDQTYAKLPGAGTPAASVSADTPKPAASMPPADALEVNEPEAASKTASPPAVPRATPAAPKAAAPASKSEPAAARAPAAAPAGWALQVGAFKSRDNAEKQVAQLKAKGYSAFVVSGQGSLFRVHVGPYAQRAEADRVAARLRQEGLKPSVTR